MPGANYMGGRRFAPLSAHAPLSSPRARTGAPPGRAPRTGAGASRSTTLGGNASSCCSDPSPACARLPRSQPRDTAPGTTLASATLCAMAPLTTAAGRQHRIQARPIQVWMQLTSPPGSGVPMRNAAARTRRRPRGSSVPLITILPVGTPAALPILRN